MPNRLSKPLYSTLLRRFVADLRSEGHIADQLSEAFEWIGLGRGQGSELTLMARRPRRTSAYFLVMLRVAGLSDKRIVSAEVSDYGMRWLGLGLARRVRCRWEEASGAGLGQRHGRGGGHARVLRAGVTHPGSSSCHTEGRDLDPSRRRIHARTALLALFTRGPRRTMRERARRASAQPLERPGKWRRRFQR